MLYPHAFGRRLNRPDCAVAADTLIGAPATPEIYGACRLPCTQCR